MKDGKSSWCPEMISFSSVNSIQIGYRGSFVFRMYKNVHRDRERAIGAFGTKTKDFL